MDQQIVLTDEIFLQDLYLTRHSIKCNNGNCCECKDFITDYFIFRPQDLDDAIQVFDRRTRPLLVFTREHPERVERAFRKMHLARRIYNEVIPEEVPRKLFIDVDDKLLKTAYADLTKKKDGIEYTKVFDKMVEEVIACFIETITYLFRESESQDEATVTTDDFAIYTSNGWEAKENRYKTSAHIVCQKYYITGKESGKRFEKEFKREVKNVEYFEVDPRMNLPTPNLRAMHNHKIGSRRVKVGTTKFLDALITYTKDRIEIEPSFAEVKEVRVYEDVMLDVNMTNLDLICSNIPTAFKCGYKQWTTTCHHLSDITGNSLEGLAIFDKWSKQHDEDGYESFERCKREWLNYKDKRGNIQQSVGALLKFVDPTIYTKMRRLMFPDDSFNKKIETEALAKEAVEYEFAENDMVTVKEINCEKLNKKCFVADGDITTVGIRSGMGTGKTFVLINKVMIPKLKEDESLRMAIISHRRSLSAQTTKNFNGNVVSYLEANGPLTQRSILVQLDSVYRIPEDYRQFDYVIIDEFVGFIDHMFNSERINRDVRIAFEQIIRNAKHVIFLDAQMDDMALRCMLYFRNQKINLVYNKFRKEDAEIAMFSDFESIMCKMMMKLKKGKRIVVPTTSKLIAKIITNYIDKYDVGEKEILTYTGDMDDEIKKEHFEAVDKAWKTADVVIYTPTCSEGVSYDDKGFDYVFGFFYDISANAETARQMMHRVRNVSTNKYYVYIRHIPGNRDMITEECIIKAHKQMKKTYKHMLRNMLKNGLIDEVGDGKIRKSFEVQKSAFYNACVLYCVRRGISHASFYDRFVELARQAGATVKQSEYIATAKNRDKLKARVKVIKKVVKEKQMDDVVKSDEMTLFEYEDLVMKAIKTTKEKNSIEKYRLQKIWGFRGTITLDVMKKFPETTGALVKTFQHVSHETAYEDYKYCLQQGIQNEKDFTMKRLEVALHLFKVCGFGKTAIESKTISEEKLLKKLQSKDNIDYLLAKKEMVHTAFSKKKTYTKEELNEKQLKPWLQLVNSILVPTFDARIKKVSRNSTSYVLELTKKFGSDIETQLPFPMTKRGDSLVGKAHKKYIEDHMLAGDDL